MEDLFKQITQIKDTIKNQFTWKVVTKEENKTVMDSTTKIDTILFKTNGIISNLKDIISEKQLIVHEVLNASSKPTRTNIYKDAALDRKPSQLKNKLIIYAKDIDACGREIKKQITPTKGKVNVTLLKK